MAARAASPDPEMDPTETEPDSDEDDTSAKKGKNKDKKPMDPNCNDAAIAQAKAEGFAEANQRFSTVLASEHYAGREQLASALLANDKLSADEIITALAAAAPAQPAASTTTGAQSAEEAARAEMRSAIEASNNSTIDAGAGGSKSKAEDAGALWASAYGTL
jgi:hypothetical protein